ANETLALNISGATNTSNAAASGTGTILNDDPVPSLSINSVSHAEGNAGATAFTFTVTLSAVSGQTVTAGFATADGTATIADGDYAATSGTVTFIPGTTTQTITVSANGDTKFEPDETFALNLSAPTNATIGTGTGTGTITNDDPDVTLS